MALWGQRDIFTLTGTAFANSTVNTSILTGTGTVFPTELEVGDTIIINGSSRKVISIASNTSLTFEPAWTAANVATTIFGRDTPKWLAANSATIQSTQFANTIYTFGVDSNEARADEHTHAGWVNVIRYTDMHGNARKKYETLVAMPSMILMMMQHSQIVSSQSTHNQHRIQQRTIRQPHSQLLRQSSQQETQSIIVGSVQRMQIQHSWI